MQPLLEKHHKPSANFTTIRSMSEWKYKINSMVQNAMAEKKKRTTTGETNFYFVVLQSMEQLNLNV